MRANLFYDLLRRHLLFSGYRLTHVMNITDVDDRIIQQAVIGNTTIGEYTAPYEAAFREDLATLRAQPVEHYPRATEHIPEMAALIEKLIEGDHAYRADGDVYFRIASFPDYGRLSHLDRKGLRKGARVATDKYEKESANDFALWKGEQAGEGVIGAAWEAPFGPGRPGWHIECSAMAARYLGETFDIHCGGIDLQFPHHENEIAQSEAASGRPLAHFWMHNEHLTLGGSTKMSKSLGNVTSLRDLIAAGHEPLAIRFFLMANAHYRRKLVLDEEALHSAAEQVRRLREFADRLERLQPPAVEDGELVVEADRARAAYRAALDDDLNLPQGLGLVFELIRQANGALDAGRVGSAGQAALQQLLADVDSHLDFLRTEVTDVLEIEVERLIEERERARASRDFATSDRIREQLRELGIVLEDTAEGVRWKRQRA